MQVVIQVLHLKVMAHFTRQMDINNVFIYEANHIYIVVPIYNFIEHTDNYSDTSGSLWQFKRD